MNLRRIVNCFFTLIFISNFVFAANSNIEGIVKDSNTGETLFGANVVLLGTGMGCASSMEGEYIIPNVSPGTYTILISYIGYETQTMEIVVKDGAKTELDFEMVFAAFESGTVTITSQAEGQTQAINQQLSSNQIINVVSAKKIQELPDANAAESLGRLPGITVLRTGGEGNAVVVRGLQPKYNRILIDGVQMSSSNPNDRGSDLSSISSNMLDGIQVSKTVTSDMDADVIGGTINFSLREAKSSERGVPSLEVLTQGSYNALSNVQNPANNYKFVLSAEDRYVDNKLGVFAQISLEKKNLSSNEVGAIYDHLGASTTEYITTSINLNYIQRDRQRYNGALVLDYKLPEGKLKFSNFFSSAKTHTINRGENFGVNDDSHSWNISNSESKGAILTSGLEFEQQLSIFKVNARLSNTFSQNENPDDWSTSFLQRGAGVGHFAQVADLNPEDVVKESNNEVEKAIMSGLTTNTSFSKENATTGALDFLTNWNISKTINTDIKIGGSYRYQTRSYDYELYNGGGTQFGDAAFVNDLIINYFNLPIERYNISLPYFVDPGFSYGEFMNGRYEMVSPVSYGMATELMNLIKSNTQNIAEYPGAISVYGRNSFASTSNDYSGSEAKSAVYAMATINIGQDITVIPGVRYQNLKTEYKGVRGIQNFDSFARYIHDDTTVTQNLGYWLPNLSLKYEPTSWFDVRLSYSETLSYPDFRAIIPRIDASNNEGTISWNNYELVPQTSTNYDIYLSFYNNTIGLFTIGGFYKNINNLIYGWSFYEIDNVTDYFPPENIVGVTPGNKPFYVSTYLNNPNKVEVYGLELDWQTHFWYLPGVLSGLVFSANYTHTSSETDYSYSSLEKVGRQSVAVDTAFTDRLLDQPDDMVNISLGYDYKDFSIRISMLYQTDIFTGVNFWPQLRSNTAPYTRWDLAVKQELPWNGIQLYGNLNNITGENDVTVIQGGGGTPLSEQQYGFVIDLGIRVTL